MFVVELDGCFALTLLMFSVGKTQEAWWLVLANATSSELYGLKRINFADREVNTRMELPQMFNIQVNEFCLAKMCLARIC